MSDFISSNVPVSEPPLKTPAVHVDMAGFAFNVDDGLFVPRHSHDLINEIPYLESLEVNDKW